MTEINIAHQKDHALVDTTNVFQPLALRAMFWRPAYLEPSAWLEHIPFAFWLIEAQRPKVFVELGSHHGTSYFAFCQAVDRLGLDTQCFAVDTWKGDEHSGLYDEKVFAKVKGHNEANYSGFSRLVRSTFDDAVHHFSDGSVDLLHIDGLHTLEAVRHDFETWLPKLSDRAIVIMHDTNVRERGFGVFKLFEELQTRYPVFQFLHGHGLGVLGVGEHQSELLERLYQGNGNDGAKRAIQEVFSRLGHACADAFAAAQQQDRANKLNDEVNKQTKQLEEFKITLDKTKADLNARAKDLSETKNRLQTQIEQHAVERGQLAERATLFQDLRTELKEEVSRLQATINGMSAELLRSTIDLRGLEEVNRSHQQRSEEHARELQKRDRRIEELIDNHRESQTEQAIIHSRLAERERDLALAGSAVQAQVEQRDALVRKLDDRESTIATLRRESDEQHAILGAETNRLALENAVLREENEKLSRESSAQISNLADQTQMLEVARAARSEQEEQRVALARKLDDRESTMATLRRESDEQHAILEAETNRLALENAVLREENEKLNRESSAHISDLADQTQMLEVTREARSEQEEQATKLRDQLLAAERFREKLTANVESRFKEIVHLTQMLQAAEAARKVQEEREAAVRKELEVAKSSLTQLSQKLAKADEQHRARPDSQRPEVQRVMRENALLQSENIELAAKLEKDLMVFGKSQAELHQELAKEAQLSQAMRETQHTSEQMIQHLERELHRRDEQLQKLAREMAKSAVLRNTGADKPRLGMLRFGMLALTNGKSKSEHKFAQQAKLLQTSGLFDPEWYLARYPDVKQENMDPIEHYLKFGANEQRDAGPLFSTKYYVETYPEVIASGINPLVHYINHGSEEGRTIQGATE